MDSDTTSASTSSQPLISLNISYAGQSYSLSLAQDANLDELKLQLYELTTVHPSVQKLLYRKIAKKKPFVDGKTEKGDSRVSLSDAGIKDGMKIQMLGPTEKELGDMDSGTSERRKRDEIMRKRAQAGPSKVRPTGVPSASTMSYRFRHIEPLAHLPKPESARALLEKLADDPAIRHIMQTHEFSVGILTELAPHENPELLGLNVNAGQSIKLRLRTDRYDGFRLYSEVRRVLCHELTHNVWGDHDDDFKALNSRLNREVAQYEIGMKQGSHQMGYDGPTYEADNPDSVDTYTHILGESSIAASGEDTREGRRQRMLDAVMMRQKKEEEELERSCGTAGPAS